MVGRFIEQQERWGLQQHLGEQQAHNPTAGKRRYFSLQIHFTEAQAEQQTIEFLQQYVTKGKSPMCGNSICQDRRFMARCMPELEAFFHYRNLDVSTLKELVTRWAPEIAKGLKKNNNHLALDDIKDSIEELKYYREHFIRLPQST